MSEDHKDYDGAKFGMWLFLMTELILFGGLFILYAVYLHRYPEGFFKGGSELNLIFGTVNTLVLLTSSLAVAMSISALQKGDKRLTLILLAATIIAAMIFMINKYFEWSAKIHHGLYPNADHLRELSHGENIFFGLYYLTTGLHGLHVVIGAALMTWLYILVRRDRVTATDYVALENTGLYWHLVDLIWIFIFPLYYLIL